MGRDQPDRKYSLYPVRLYSKALEADAMGYGTGRQGNRMLFEENIVEFDTDGCLRRSGTQAFQCSDSLAGLLSQLWLPVGQQFATLPMIRM